MRSGRKRPAAVCLLLVAALPALSACGSGGSSNSGARGSASGHVMQQTLPAEIDRNPQTFTSPELLNVENAWRVSSHREFTQVEAGSMATHHSVGAFAIFRHEFVSARQHVNTVKVVGSGPLRITQAPEGATVESSAQRNGKIQFEGSAGVRGTLLLRNDTVKLQPASSVKPDD